MTTLSHRCSSHLCIVALVRAIDGRPDVDPPCVVAPLPQTLQREIEGHQPRVDEVQERGRRMAAASIAAAAIAAATTGAPGGGEGEGTPEARRIAREVGALEQAWGRLGEEMERRKERLGGADEAQQYLNDAEEAEAWIGEQELYMISDETPKVRRRGRPESHPPETPFSGPLVGPCP